MQEMSIAPGTVDVLVAFRHRDRRRLAKVDAAIALDPVACHRRRPFPALPLAPRRDGSHQRAKASWAGDARDRHLFDAVHEPRDPRLAAQAGKPPLGSAASPGRCWHARPRCWSAPASAAATVGELLQALGLRVIGVSRAARRSGLWPYGAYRKACRGRP